MRLLSVLLLVLLAAGGTAGDPTLAELARARRDRAAKMFDTVLSRSNEPAAPREKLRIDPGMFEAAYQWSRRWLEAEQELAGKDVDRLAALEAHARRMKKMLELAAVLRDAGELARNYKEGVEFYDLEAQSWLKKAREKK